MAANALSEVLGHKRLVRTKSGLRMICKDERFKSPFTIEEPPWVPDNECPECMKCKVKFDFLTRRHHCRRCGECFCNKCCDNRLHLPRMCFVDPVRHCDTCVSKSKRELEVFEKHIKTLHSGAYLTATSSNIDSSSRSPTLFHCRLSADQRSILLESDSAPPAGGPATLSSSRPDSTAHRSILVSSMCSLQVLTGGVDEEGNVSAVSGVLLEHFNSQRVSEEMRLMVSPAPVPEPSPSAGAVSPRVWIAALEKVFALICDTDGNLPLPLLQVS